MAKGAVGKIRQGIKVAKPTPKKMASGGAAKKSC